MTQMLEDNGGTNKVLSDQSLQSQRLVETDAQCAKPLVIGSSEPAFGINARLCKDHVVNEGVESADAKKIGRIHLLVAHGRAVSLLLGLVIALATTAVIVHDRSDKEQLFRKYINDAELLEYDEFYDRAFVSWEKAINAGIQLGDKPKLVADLHVKAAVAEEGIGSQNCALVNNNINNRKLLHFSEERTATARNEQRKHLSAAFNLYQKIPNTTAEQISTLDKLIPLIRMELPEFSQRSASCSPTLVVLNPAGPAKDADADILLQRGLSELKAKRPGLGLSYFKKFLHRTSASIYISPTAESVTYDKSFDKTRLSDLIHLYHEIIYYSHSEPENFESEQQTLDWVLQSYGFNPYSLDHRLHIADFAASIGDYHGAIVEYLRCLGMKNDQKVREKLFRNLRLARQADFGPTEPLAELYILLKTQLKLDQQAFGKDSKKVQEALYELGLADGIVNNLTEAEQELKSIKLKGNNPYDYPSRAQVAFALADVYSKEGKCNEAVAQYRAGLGLDSKDHWELSAYFAKVRLAYAYVCAGRYKEATQAEKQSPKEQIPSLTGTSSGSIGNSGPMIE